MANDKTKGEPLTAQVGEQLEEKARLDEARVAERAADDPVARAVERKKEEEREAAARHAIPGAAAPPPAEAAKAVRRARREAADRSARKGARRWGILLGGLVLFGALVAVRRLVGRR